VGVLLYSAPTLVADPYSKENNEYTTVIYNHEGAHGLTADGQKAIFTDHSDDFGEPSSPARKRLRSGPASLARGFDLPNPLCVGVHAAIAGVLHMSGAGDSIKQALDRAGARDENSFHWRCFRLSRFGGEFGRVNEPSRRLLDTSVIASGLYQRHGCKRSVVGKLYGRSFKYDGL